MSSGLIFLTLARTFIRIITPLLVVTHCLNIVKRTSKKVLIFAVGDSALRKIVRCQLNLYAVTWHEADIVLSHLAGDVSYYLVAVLKLDSKLCAWQCFDNNTSQFDDLLVPRHRYNLLNCSKFYMHCKMVF